MPTVRLTMAQALVRYLCSQFTMIDGKREPLFPGVFAIFGHGNVTCLSEALEAVKDTLPTWRGQNEQSMALAAIGYAKAKRRRQIMVALASIGPGALNMVTAAGSAHANRLPVLFLAGDVFANRRPDPVLQQVEHFGNPTTSVNDAFKAVTRYWDRITHPEQIISSLPQAVATMLDPGDCGPAFIGLCQDTQELAYDYPEAFFAETIHAIARPRPDALRVAEAVKLIKTAKRPLIISGGGVRYSHAETEVAAFALARGIPLAETIAGKGAVTHGHPAHVGPIGVVGSTSANELAGEADVIIAIGTRLQDFTTGSWTVFSHEARFVSINAARYDAVKHRALSVVGDARETVDRTRRSPRRLQSAEQPGRRRARRPSRAGTILSTNTRRRPTRRCRVMRMSSASSTHGRRPTIPWSRPRADFPAKPQKAGASKTPTPTISNSGSRSWVTKLPVAGAMPWPRTAMVKRL